MALPTCTRCKAQPAIAHVKGPRLPRSGVYTCDPCLLPTQTAAGAEWSSTLLEDDGKDTLFNLNTG